MPDFILGHTLNICRLAVVVEIAGNLPTVVKNPDLSLLVIISVQKGALGEDRMTFFQILVAPDHHREHFVLVD